MRSSHIALMAGALIMASSVAVAQSRPSAKTVGARATSSGSATVGTAGTASAGGTSASTIGLGGWSSSATGTSSTVGGAASASAVSGRATARNTVQQNPRMVMDRARASARDGGTWSTSMTNTMVRNNGNLSSWTRSMSHQPGGAPARSMTRQRTR